MPSLVTIFLSLKKWPMRATIAACLLLCGFAWSLYRHYSVTEIRYAESLSFLPVASIRPAADDWPGVGGPSGDGTCTRMELPRESSAPYGPAWHTALPGPATGGPCVWGNIVVTTILEARTLSFVAIDRRDGQILWKTPLHSDLQLSATAQRSTAMPACDGQSFLIGAVSNERLIVSAVDFQGRLRWRTDVGPMPNQNGRLISPLIHGSLVIASGENQGSAWLPGLSSSHLSAVHRLTGEIIWRVPRPRGEGQATPVIAEVAGRTQLIIPAAGRITSYNPATGDSLWSCRWNANRTANSVAWNNELVFVATRDPHPVTLAIRADGAGDVTDTHRAWQSSAFSSTTISLVRHRDTLIGLSEEGGLICVDEGTGKIQWRRQLSGSFTLPPIIAGDDLRCMSHEGTTFLVDLAERGKLVSQQAGISGVIAPLAPTSRQLLLRSPTDLVCWPWDATELPLVNTPERPRPRL